MTAAPRTTVSVLLRTCTVASNDLPGLPLISLGAPATRSTPSATVTSAVRVIGATPSAEKVSLTVPLLPSAALVAVMPATKSPTTPAGLIQVSQGVVQVILA